MSRRTAGVLGSPIEHSKSPALHRAAYRGLGLDWEYGRYEVDEAGLPAFISGLDGNWAGLSLTMPLKEAVLPLLAEVDDLAALLRSVNTVLPGREPGTWRGTNTDVEGIVEAVTQAAGGEPVAGGAVILGAGATARSALAAIARLGCSHAVVCARRPEAAAEVALLGGALGIEAMPATLEPDESLVALPLVVSTLPGDAARGWAGIAGAASGVLLDASYHPWPTPLASAWRGRAVASGRDMLLWQAVAQVRLMTGLEPDPALMRAALDQ